MRAGGPSTPAASPADGVARIRSHWAERHYRNGYYLMLNSATGAAAGLLFWLVLVRLYGLQERDVGVGLAVISLCTIVGLLAKGGLDLALVRHVPGSSRAHGLRLLGLAALVGLAGVAAVVAALALPAALGAAPSWLDAPALVLVAALGAALLVTWLQDAHFLAEGEARFSFYRNLVMHGARLGAPVPVLALALPHPIPVAWGAALALSAVAALAMVRWLPAAGLAGRTRRVAPRAFLRTSARNVAGSAAEFLPGLLLPILVLHLQGPMAAAHFGIAWTGASMLFLLSAAICRSTLAEMSRSGQHARWLRRAARHHVLVVAPAAAGAMAAAPWLLGLFGPGYAAEGWAAFLLLAGSVALTAPVYLYFTLLRARDERGALVAVPALLVAALLALAPPMVAAWGLAGVGAAWALAHAPLAALAVWKLRGALAEPEEVTLADPEPSPAHGGAPHLE